MSRFLAISKFLGLALGPASQSPSDAIVKPDAIQDSQQEDVASSLTTGVGSTTPSSFPQSTSESLVREESSRSHGGEGLPTTPPTAPTSTFTTTSDPVEVSDPPALVADIADAVSSSLTLPAATPPTATTTMTVTQAPDTFAPVVEEVIKDTVSLKAPNSIREGPIPEEAATPVSSPPTLITMTHEKNTVAPTPAAAAPSTLPLESSSPVLAPAQPIENVPASFQGREFMVPIAAPTSPEMEELIRLRALYAAHQAELTHLQSLNAKTEQDLHTLRESHAHQIFSQLECQSQLEHEISLLKDANARLEERNAQVERMNAELQGCVAKARQEMQKDLSRRLEDAQETFNARLEEKEVQIENLKAESERVREDLESRLRKSEDALTNANKNVLLRRSLMDQLLALLEWRQNQARRLEGELNELRRSAEAERDSLIGELKRVESLLIDERDGHADVSKRNVELEDALKDRVMEIEQLREDVLGQQQALRDQAFRANEEIQTLQGAVKHHQDKAKKLEEQNAGLVVRVQVSNAANESLQRNLLDLRSELEAQLAEKEDVMRVLREEFAEYREDKERRINGFEDAVKKKKQDLAEQRGLVTQLTAQVEQCNAVISSLEEEQKELSEDVNRLKGALENEVETTRQEVVRVGELEADRVRHLEEITLLREEVRRRQDELREQASAAEDNIRKLQGANAELTTKLEETISSARETLQDSLRELRVEFDGRIKRKNETLRLLRAEIRALAGELKADTDRMGELSEMVESAIMAKYDYMI